MSVYSTLTRAMSLRGVTQKMIAQLLSQHYNTVNAKIMGKRDFSLIEARLIHEKWFKDFDFIALFERAEEDTK